MISKIKSFFAVLLILIFNSQVFAAPVGGDVVHGNANITQNGSNTIINQNSDSAIINWDSFDINKGESVHFNQNSSSSIVLNRVTNGLPTSIFGNLTANGNVFVINQAGVLVGNGAVINTHGFLAGAANITDKDFITGNYNFYDAKGSVINNGSIKVQNGGYAVLLGKNVENNGLIAAKLGKIYLSSGEAFRVDMSGNDLIGVYVEKAANEAHTSNTGKLHAEGGTIVMTAKNASNVIRQAVNNTGVIDASSISYVGGKVILGAENGEIVNSGEINVSSQTDSAGSIEIKSDNIVNDGSLKANGLNGGVINLYANNLLQINGNSLIQANAFGYGNGGNIYLISPNRAESYKGAVIEANSVYGKGGFIELSGHKSVYAFSDFYTKSLFGAYGRFVLDPSDMFIGYYANLADNENNVVSNDGNTYIDITWLNNQLASTDIELKSLPGNGSGNITLNSGVSINGTNGLTLNASNSINLLGNINVGKLSLLANGDITGNNAITTTGDINVTSYNGNIQLTKLNITGKSTFLAEKGNVYLVGDSLGTINQISGLSVGVEATGTGTITGDTTVTNRAVIEGNDITLKAGGAINTTVDTKQLSAENTSGAITIENKNTNETILLKYFGADASTYTQNNGKINLSNIPQDAINTSGLTINSTYGTIFAQNRLDAIKGYTNLSMNANIIHFVETGSSALTIDDTAIKGTATKYIFDNVGNIEIGNITPTSLQNSGLEVISRTGTVNTASPINAMYFSANAFGDINVTSQFLGGASFESSQGNINFTHNGGPISIRGLKAVNGNINVNTTLPGNLYISGLASNNPVTLSANNADIVSVSGSGETALNINLTNGSGKYKLDASNGRDLVLNTNTNTFTELSLSSGGNLSFPVANNTITADKTISLTGNNINNNAEMTLTAADSVYINLRQGNQSYIIDTANVDLNGNNLSVNLLKDTTFKDVDLDKNAGNIYGSLNVSTDKNVSLDGKMNVANLNLNALGFNFGNNLGIINGSNIKMTTTNDISGVGKISAKRVDLTANTIGAAVPLLINSDFAYLTSTATNKTADDILININSNNWIYGYKMYSFKTNGLGSSYIGGRKVDYAANQQIRESRIRGKLPIEATNIDRVEGDDLIKGGRLLDPSELITVEKANPSKVQSIKKRNKNIELK